MIDLSSFRPGDWLLTSAAAKVPLLRLLQEALRPYGRRVVACDLEADRAAMHLADDRFLLPPVDDPAWLGQLIDACRCRGVRVIVPGRDGDLLALAEAAPALAEAGLLLLAPPARTIRLCLDKLDFHAFGTARGLPVGPRLQRLGPDDYPVFVRPRRGSAGHGSGLADSKAALTGQLAGRPAAEFLIQPAVAAPEYSIDALFGPDGGLRQWVARRRLWVVDGESKAAQTVDGAIFAPLMERLAATLDLFGHVTLQAFVLPDGGVQLIEVNPRFGGASALGIRAGLESPRRLAALLEGDTEAFGRNGPLRIGLKMLRYSEDILIEEDR